MDVQLFSAASSSLNLTAAFVFVAWLGVFLATAGLVMFYKCSRFLIYITFIIVVIFSSISISCF